MFSLFIDAEQYYFCPWDCRITFFLKSKSKKCFVLDINADFLTFFRSRKYPKDGVVV